MEPDRNHLLKTGGNVTDVCRQAKCRVTRRVDQWLQSCNENSSVNVRNGSESPVKETTGRSEPTMKIAFLSFFYRRSYRHNHCIDDVILH